MRACVRACTGTSVCTTALTPAHSLRTRSAEGARDAVSACAALLCHSAASNKRWDAPRDDFCAHARRGVKVRDGAGGHVLIGGRVHLVLRGQVDPHLQGKTQRDARETPSEKCAARGMRRGQVVADVAVRGARLKAVQQAARVVCARHARKANTARLVSARRTERTRIGAATGARTAPFVVLDAARRRHPLAVARVQNALRATAAAASVVRAMWVISLHAKRVTQAEPHRVAHAVAVRALPSLEVHHRVEACTQPCRPDTQAHGGP